MWTKERLCSAGTLVQEENGSQRGLLQISGKEIYAGWPVSWYFGSEEMVWRPHEVPSPSQLCRDPMVEMLAKIGRRVKISLQSPTFAPQRTYTVRDKRSMGCEPLQWCFWTCIIDKLCFNMRTREMTIKRNIRNLLFWWQKIIIIFNQNFNLWVYCRANFLLAFFLVDILTIEIFLVDSLIFLEIS